MYVSVYVYMIDFSYLYTSTNGVKNTMCYKKRKEMQHLTVVKYFKATHF